MAERNLVSPALINHPHYLADSRFIPYTSCKVMGNFLEVFNFNGFFLKLNWFMNS